MKTIILYYSNHHGNTKKLVDAIQASDPENVEILDVTTAGPKDLSGYDLIGVASGIYAGNFGKPLLNYMSENTRPVFLRPPRRSLRRRSARQWVSIAAPVTTLLDRLS